MNPSPISQSALRIEPITARAVTIRCPHCAMLLALAWADRIDMSGDDTIARHPMAWIGDHIRDLWPAFRAAVMAANGQAEVPSHARRT